MVRFLGSLFLAIILVCLAAIVPAGAAGGSHSFTASGFNYDGVAHIVQDSVPVSASSRAIVGDLGDSIGTIARAAGSPSQKSHSQVAPTSVVSVPSPTDTKLQNYVNQLFKHANQPGRIGDGTTMAALPSELAAGAGPHIQKATEIRNGLARWLRTSAGQNASAADRAIAQDLFDQLDELLP